MSIILTSDQLIDLTRRKTPGAQARILRRLGIPYRAHPQDGVLLVPASAALSVLGADLEELRAREEDEYSVNTIGIQRHGTKAPSR